MGISDLEPGLYHYCPKEFSLHKLRDGWQAISALKRGRPDLEPLKTMPAVLLVSSLFWRSAWRYGNRAYRYAALDAGHVVENLVQCASGLGIQTVVRLQLNERNTRELIGCPAGDEFDQCEAVQGMVAWSDKAMKPIEPPAQRLPTGTLEPIRRPRVSASSTEFPEIPRCPRGLLSAWRRPPRGPPAVYRDGPSARGHGTRRVRGRGYLQRHGPDAGHAQTPQHTRIRRPPDLGRPVRKTQSRDLPLGHLLPGHAQGRSPGPRAGLLVCAQRHRRDPRGSGTTTRSTTSTRPSVTATSASTPSTSATTRISSPTARPCAW